MTDASIMLLILALSNLAAFIAGAVVYRYVHVRLADPLADSLESQSTSSRSLVEASKVLTHAVETLNQHNNLLVEMAAPRAPAPDPRTPEQIEAEKKEAEERWKNHPSRRPQRTT